MEHLEFDLAPVHTAGSSPPLPPNSTITSFWNDLVRASAAAGRPVSYDPESTRRALAGAGFVDIDHRVVPVPWRYDRSRTQDASFRIGATFDVCFLKGCGLESYALAPFARVNGWPVEEVKKYIGAVCEEFYRSRVEIESRIHLWRARKP